MRVDARNKSGAEFFQATFCYPTHLICIVMWMFEQFQYVREYIDFTWIYIKIKHRIDDRIQSKRKLNYICCIGVTPPIHFSYFFFVL